MSWLNFEVVSVRRYLDKCLLVVVGLLKVELRILLSLGFVFFFQAEDGIRDVAVTGVQTCALPILVLRAASSFVVEKYGGDTMATFSNDGPVTLYHDKIGRASCRERV